MIAYLMPNMADEPKDGLAFIAWAPTEQEAIAKLKDQLRRNYEEDHAGIVWVTEDPDQRPHVYATWKSEDDGEECTDFYWLHLADD